LTNIKVFDLTCRRIKRSLNYTFVISSLLLI